MITYYHLVSDVAQQVVFIAYGRELPAKFLPLRIWTIANSVEHLGVVKTL